MPDWSEIVASLKPTEHERIIDAVTASGIDASDWKSPTNPKYCYDWAFASPAKDRILLCLWFLDLEVDDAGIYQSGNIRPYILEMEASGSPKARRARKFDELLQDAWRLRSELRVAIVDESDRTKARKKKGGASVAAFRQMDPLSWNLERYDQFTGDFLVRRQERSESEGQSASPRLHQTASMADKRDGPLAIAPERVVPEPEPESSSPSLTEDLANLLGRTDLSPTERETLVFARVGQGRFRAELIRLWESKCCVSGCAFLPVLRASHIKPWRECDDSERLDPNNGLLLTANLDAMFDSGFISFDDDGSMLVSHVLGEAQRAELGVPRDLPIPLNSAQKLYMDYHRTCRFVLQETPN